MKWNFPGWLKNNMTIFWDIWLISKKILKP